MTEHVYGGGIYLIILVLGVGTFLLRYSFLGLPGGFKPSRRLARALDLAPAAIMCALAAPLMLAGSEGGLRADPALLLAGAATVVVGAVTKSFVWALLAGVAVLEVGAWLI